MGLPACGQTVLLIAAANVFGLVPGPTGGQSQPSATGPTPIQDDASRWLAVLREKGPLTNERLLVVAQSGEIIDLVDGGKSHVKFPSRLRPYLTDARNPITLVHNHPAGNGLNANDLGLLARPGVQRIIAVTQDGSFYEASAAPPIDPATLEPCWYDRAQKALERALQRDRQLFDRYAVDENYGHLIALVLSRAGAITYRATLGGYRRLSWAVYRIAFERAVTAAGDDVRRDIDRRPCRT